MHGVIATLLLHTSALLCRCMKMALVHDLAEGTMPLSSSNSHGSDATRLLNDPAVNV